MTLQVPILDMATARGDQAQRRQFVDAMAAGFSEVGFVALRRHGIAASLVTAAYDASRRLFALPEATKRAYHRPELHGARGYTPFGIETAKDHDRPDLKEFWHVGREGADGVAPEGLPDNLWPHEVTGFRQAMSALYGALDALGDEILRLIAVALTLPPNYFASATDRGNSILRPLHYPPLSGDPAGAIRAGAHEDINLITLLVGSAQSGLQILTREGDWIDAPSGQELIVCNVGDMLQRLTNHVLASTTHRVVNPPGDDNVSRYSIPFFLHPNSDFEIRTLPSCIDDAHPNRYPEPILADDYLKKRLREIGLM